MSAENLDVFVNCPFDQDYRASFEAMLFTIVAAGFRPRCALEENDSGDIRFERLCRLIAGCDRSIHDLSRTELSANDLPRFNMPFELGLLMGARRFGGSRQRRKTALTMVAEPYRLPAYLSDLGGNDPEAHHSQPGEVIRIVRKYLHATPDGKPLPGAHRFIERFGQLMSHLPRLAERLEIAVDEVDPYADYRTYLWLLAEFMQTVRRGLAPRR